MSHFKLIVLVDTKKNSLHELLMPYYEGSIHDCPRDFLEFTECEEPYLIEYEQHKEEYDTLDEFMEDYYCYYKDEETGKYGTYHNPYGKWDKYSTGGLWSDTLVLTNGEKSSSAKIKDIDFDKTKDLNRCIAKKEWESYINKNHKGFVKIYNSDTEETFLERESFFYSQDVISSNEYWHSQNDSTSYFKYHIASSYEHSQYQYRTTICLNHEDIKDSYNWAKDFYNNFIKNADPELELTIVDYHI